MQKGMFNRSVVLSEQDTVMKERRGSDNTSPSKRESAVEHTKADESADHQRHGSKERSKYLDGIFGTPKLMEKCNNHVETSREKGFQG